MEPQFTRVDRLNSIDPDNIYYNLSMTNGNLSGGSENDPQIRFQEARDRPIVRDASKYEMSVIKFNINGASKNLPLLVPQLAPAMSATASQTTTTVTVTTSVPHGLRTTTKALTRITLGTPTGGTGTTNVDGVYAITVTSNTAFTFTALVSQSPTWTIQTNAVYSYEKLAYILTMGRTAVSATPTILNAIYYSMPIYWASETDAPLIASAPNTMDLSNDYFYVYHYYHWIGLVNTALQAIITRLTISTANSVFTTAALAVASPNAATGTGDTTGTVASTATGSDNPRMKIAYNPATKLHSFYASTANWGTGAQAKVNATTANVDVFSLYYNTNFEGLFTNFHNQYTQASVNYEHLLNFNNASDGQVNAWLLPTITPGAPAAPYVAASYDWVITQDSNSTTSLWCPVDAIVFTATGIPVRNEEGSTVTRVGNTTIGGSVGGNGSFGSIISEVTFDQQSASDWRGFVYYQPYAQYQIASLDGSDVEVRNIDIYAWWRSRLNGQLIPLRLYNNGSASMKLLFRRKK